MHLAVVMPHKYGESISTFASGTINLLPSAKSTIVVNPVSASSDTNERRTTVMSLPVSHRTDTVFPTKVLQNRHPAFRSAILPLHTYCPGHVFSLPVVGVLMTASQFFLFGQYTRSLLLHGGFPLATLNITPGILTIPTIRLFRPIPTIRHYVTCFMTNETLQRRLWGRALIF